MQKLVFIMSEFVKRTLSGAVYVGVVVSSILVHPAFFGLVFLLVSMLAVRESHHLMQTNRTTAFMSVIAAGLLFMVCWAPFGLSDVPVCYGGLMTIGLVLYLLTVIAALLAELWLKAENPVRNWGNTLQVQFMVAFPFAVMPWLAFIDKYLLLAVFVLIWVNDSFAYCVGVLTAKMPGGNHKMFPRVSPKKSWEGLIGGIVFTIGAAMLLNYFEWFDTITKESNGWLIAGCFGLVVSGFGTLGDLMESLFKRTIGVKDSGRFLPGHGGVLDRFDSILLAAPMAFLFAYLVS